MPLTTISAVRIAFWAAHPGLHCVWTHGRRARQNAQSADTRVAFVDYVDALARNGTISESLAQRVTL